MREPQAEAPAPDHAAPEPLPPRTPASAARATASRENGRKSRGPKTIQGKGRSRFNRLKHGLCAATTVLPGEDAAAFADRLTAWTRDLDPQCDLEGYFVADAVAASWKLDRGRRVEAVALGQQVATAATRFDGALTDRRDADAARLEREPLDALRSLGRDAAGCRWLVERWRHLGDALRRRGAFDDAGCHDFLALLGHEPSVEGLDHPEARRALAAALALRYPARPAVEVLVAVLARLLVLHCPDPLSFAAVDGQIAELRQARRPEAREARRAAAEALRAGWPEAAAARRNLEAWVGQQVARWEARLAAEAPREAAARAAAVAEAAVDLGAPGQARLRYEQAHRRAFHGALKGLRDEQARRRQATDEGVGEASEEAVDEAPGELDEGVGCGVQAEDAGHAETLGDPDLAITLGSGFRGEWEESVAPGEELSLAVVTIEAPAGADQTRAGVAGGTGSVTPRGRSAPGAERTVMSRCDTPPHESACKHADPEAGTFRASTRTPKRGLSEQARGPRSGDFQSKHADPEAGTFRATRDRGAPAAGPSLSKALDESLRPRNRKERKRLAAMRRDIERAERGRPGRGAAAPNEPKTVPGREPNRPASLDALDRWLGEPPDEPVLNIAATPS